jgi:nucleoid-associated protein Lsr2
MAQIREIRLVDDLDGSEAVETVLFGIDGRQLEIDLNADHAKALRENLADFVEKARKAGKGQDVAPAGRARRTAGGSPVRADREQTQAIREWARQNGHTVSDRGRIPAVVLREFEAAH